MLLEYIITCNCRNKVYHFSSILELDKLYNKVSQNICPTCNSNIDRKFISICESDYIEIKDDNL